MTWTARDRSDVAHDRGQVPRARAGLQARSGRDTGPLRGGPGCVRRAGKPVRMHAGAHGLVAARVFGDDGFKDMFERT
ncbi:hypothetical protein [Nannocystis sp. SCPEA4]|uniref:hypothetical protein n=1 Tax=Nannocystis sp. SCPEA4 TaxID=2996787 RepID=UPI002271FD21|nr:hypothetical protein [Nannocystis sp. SCPEA4]